MKKATATIIVLAVLGTLYFANHREEIPPQEVIKDFETQLDFETEQWKEANEYCVRQFGIKGCKSL